MYALIVWLGRCRLAGVALAAPAVNYWWPLPANMSRTAYGKLHVRDRRTFWITHHAPSLLHAWLAQKSLSASSVWAENCSMRSRSGGGGSLSMRPVRSGNGSTTGGVCVVRPSGDQRSSKAPACSRGSSTSSCMQSLVAVLAGLYKLLHAVVAPHAPARLLHAVG